ncbi:hypothetical protein PBAL39_12518 [Pedobacter sp. BAL39]|nr:hypothetical protein PBAL39_12518 [Pedobacter sp. BAL39]
MISHQKDIWHIVWKNTLNTLNEDTSTHSNKMHQTLNEDTSTHSIKCITLKKTSLVNISHLKIIHKPHSQKPFSAPNLRHTGFLPFRQNHHHICFTNSDLPPAYAKLPMDDAKKNRCAMRTCKIFPSKDFESEAHTGFFF